MKRFVKDVPPAENETDPESRFPFALFGVLNPQEAHAADRLSGSFHLECADRGRTADARRPDCRAALRHAYGGHEHRTRLRLRRRELDRARRRLGSASTALSSSACVRHDLEMQGGRVVREIRIGLLRLHSRSDVVTADPVHDHVPCVPSFDGAGPVREERLLAHRRVDLAAALACIRAVRSPAQTIGKACPHDDRLGDARRSVDTDPELESRARRRRRMEEVGSVEDLDSGADVVGSG